MLQRRNVMVFQEVGRLVGPTDIYLIMSTTNSPRERKKRYNTKRENVTTLEKRWKSWLNLNKQIRTCHASRKKRADNFVVQWAKVSPTSQPHDPHPTKKKYIKNTAHHQVDIYLNYKPLSKFWGKPLPPSTTLFLRKTILDSVLASREVNESQK